MPLCESARITTSCTITPVAELKTQPTKASVAQFLNAIEDKQRKADCKAVAKLMQAATKAKPKMWGASIVGFGSYHYKSVSCEGDWFLTGFSPRKDALTLYLMGGFASHPELVAKLGKHKAGKGCLYVKKLADVDQKVLKELIEKSVKALKEIEARDRTADRG